MRAPPLPIPNREVKPHHADGTAKAGEQVIAALEEGDVPKGMSPFFCRIVITAGLRCCSRHSCSVM